MVETLQTRDVEFTSLPENIKIIEALVERLKSELDMSEEMEANILISLCEAVTNAIFHGNKQSPGKKVKVRVELRKRILSFYIEDEGFGFNLIKIKNPTLPENIQNPTGRGIYLMNHLADRVEFFEGGRKVVLTFFQ
ncbi:MAG: ATP-binding protein [Chitinophagales bacterium]|nr:ATP-binding protein [Chitinophagales bacterium]